MSERSMGIQDRHQFAVVDRYAANKAILQYRLGVPTKAVVKVEGDTIKTTPIKNTEVGITKTPPGTPQDAALNEQKSGPIKGSGAPVLLILSAAIEPAVTPETLNAESANSHLGMNIDQAR